MQHRSPDDPSQTRLSGAPDAGPQEVLPIVEERLNVTKVAVETGRVRIRTITETTEEMVREQCSDETLHVERVPINRVLELGEALPQTRKEGEITIVPIFEEVMVVEKRLVLKEEVRLSRHVTTESIEQPIPLRKQRVVIERLDIHGNVIHPEPSA